MSKKIATPKYRFIDFKDDLQWSIGLLKDFSIPIKKRAGVNKYTTLSITSGTGLVSQAEKFGREIAGSSYKNYLVIQRGDFAYNKSATKVFPEGYIAMLSEYDEGAVPNSIFTCFRITDENVCVNFIKHLFQSNYHGAWLRRFITVGARAHGSLNIDDKNLWDLPVALPKYSEQQKIADCLTSLDELIAAENKKLEALKTHKKGLMQKTFPVEGQSVPEVRFNGYTGAWELRNVGEYVRDYVERTTEQNQHPVLTSSQQQGIVFQEDYFSNRQITTTNNIGYFVLPRGYFTYRSRSDNGMFRFNRNDLIDRGIISYFYPVFSIINGDSDFFLQLLNSQIYKQAALAAEGTGQKVLSLKKFKNIKIVVPNFQEQSAIGAFFRNLDEVISAQAEKIEDLKQHKKGLMQGLFPSAQEVME